LGIIPVFGTFAPVLFRILIRVSLPTKFKESRRFWEGRAVGRWKNMKEEQVCPSGVYTSVRALSGDRIPAPVIQTEKQGM